MQSFAADAKALQDCSVDGLVAATVASAAYAKFMVDLARSATKAGLPCMVVALANLPLGGGKAVIM